MKIFTGQQCKLIESIFFSLKSFLVKIKFLSIIDMIEGKKKVLVISTSSKTRGGITSVINAHKNGKQWKAYKCKCIETHMDKGVMFKIYYFFKSIFIFLLNLPFYNILHIHLSQPPSAFRKVIFLVLGKLFGKKVIIHFHSFSIETTIKGKFRWLYEFIFKKADMIIVLSEYWKNEINRAFGMADKLNVLYNPCSKPEFSVNYNSKNNILFAGTLNKRKGYRDLILAFSMIAGKYSEWKLIFAGNGEIEKAKLLVREKGIQDQVVFLGWVNGSEKNKAFQEARIFCLPSYAEGFPMAVLDAWSYGLPVITTPVGGLSDILTNNVNALVFNPGDVENLSLHLEKLISDEIFSGQLKVESLNFADNIFSEKEINKQLGNLYSTI